MSNFQKLPNTGFSVQEDQIIAFWKENKIFEKSINIRANAQPYSFLDGPPFPSGMPHYGHLLMSVAKDTIPRFQTMKGKRVRRVFGWDCHGVAVEAKVNKELNISTRRQIEQFGIANYVKECRKYVENCIANWQWYIEKIGRWVDMDNAYYTMYPEYHESVLWSFKQIWDKGFIYKGKRVSLFSVETGTPVSDFEVAEADDYRDTEDVSVFVKFKLITGKYKDHYIVAWTTTPWTLPSNFALGVKPDETYCIVEYNNQKLILAKSRLEFSFEKLEYKLLEEITSDSLANSKYEPVFDYFKSQSNPNDYTIYQDDGVTNADGTGVLHIAPAFGQQDFDLGKKFNLSDKADIDEEGKLVVDPWKGIYLRKASPLIADHLEQQGALLRQHKYTHRLPFYRGSQPLIYMALDSYFIDIQRIKKQMLDLNQNINWVPEAVKTNRFPSIIESSPDWCISRNRYWATIMPLWKSEDADIIVIGGFEELLQYTDQVVKKDGKYFINNEPLSAHRDKCDQIILTKDGKKYTRIPEVLDVWLDSGSAPFAEHHYPFENKEKFESAFPVDFVVEGAGMVRAWFNVLHRVSTMIFDKQAFNSVICAGTFAGNDGRKMSKTYGNYTDPKKVLEEIGSEALRLYTLGSPVMAGGEANWSDELLKQQVQTVLIPLQNIANYLVIYGDKYDFKPGVHAPVELLNVWITNRANELTFGVNQALETYNIPEAVRLIHPFLDNLSAWYIRRCRDEFAQGSTEHLQTLYTVLLQTIKTIAPITPFITETIYQNIFKQFEGIESIHLFDYPSVTAPTDVDTQKNMASTRLICTQIHELRQKAGQKIRQPLASATVVSQTLPLDFIKIVLEETNLKALNFIKTGQDSLDSNLTPELISEGEYRDLVRSIQNLRKEAGLSLDDKIKIIAPSWPTSFQKELLDKTLGISIEKGESLIIQKVA